MKHKKRAREIPKGSRASEGEPDKKLKRIREVIHDMRLLPYARDPKTVALNANCTLEEAIRELATLQ